MARNESDGEGRSLSDTVGGPGSGLLRLSEPGGFQITGCIQLDGHADEMALALDAAGMKREGAEWLRKADDYHQDILNSMQSAVFRDHGIDVLPIEPLTHRLEKQGSEFYYSLVAPLVLETEFFPGYLLRYHWVTDFMEQRGGLLLGMGTGCGRSGSRLHLRLCFGENVHGDVNKLLLTFYSSLAYGMTRDTYSAVEFTDITEGFNENTLPHTYSNTQQMRMLRMMFVKEEGGELWIAPGTPKAWLDTRDGFSLRKAPTDISERSVINSGRSG